ncbi:MAG: HEAT repeat domain-containing protein [Opitutales bacterium]
MFWLRLFLLCALWIAGTFAASAVLIAPTDALSPIEQKAKFKLPEGFEIQLVLSEPMIGQPMNLNFDARGRLWVTSSVEYPYPARGDLDPRGRFARVGDHDPRDFLTVVEGIGADGKPAKVTRFAEGLNIPIGNVPLGDGRQALVYSIPNIYRVIDNDGDGKAEVREKLYGRIGNVDTHGMVNSFTRWCDGWIYGCHGFANSSTITDGSGRVTKLQSGNTYRFRADGSRFEQFTWGQVNPFGLCFDPLGNAYTADCHSKPVTMLLRGAYYSSFGKPHDGLGFGPNMIDHNHGSTGICGVTYYDGDHFPPEYRDNLFICNPVTGKVHRDKLQRFGSSYLVDSQPDFITCEDQWFRPVDVQLGPDGALYLADFYNAIIGHYEVRLDHPKRDRTHGRIWRIIWRGVDGEGKAPSPMSDLTRLSPSDLAANLAAANIVVRTLATNQLVDRGRKIVETVSKFMDSAADPKALAHAAWVLERLGGLPDNRFAKLRGHDDRLVRVHLARILAERSKWGKRERQWVSDFLGDKNPFVRRVAADAVGRTPDPTSFAPLMKVWDEAEEKDTHLVHVVRIALRNHLAAGAFPADAWKAAGRRANELLDVAFAAKGVKSAELVASYLMEQEKTVDEKALQAAGFVAERLEPADLTRVVRSLDERAGDDLALRLRLQRAFWQGTKKGGRGYPKELRALAERLVRKWMKHSEANSPVWTAVPFGGSLSENPWTKGARRCADGKEAVMLSSFPKGEKLVGAYRSQPFVLPERLSFYLAGHRGYPGKPPHGKNKVNLRLLETDAVLFIAFPPRNDVARKVEWHLGDRAGQKGLLELVDGDAGGAYAWLAVGRVDPAVVKIEPETISRRDALHLAADLELSDLFEPMLALLDATGESPEIRLAALDSCRRLDEERTSPAARKLVIDLAAPESLRRAIIGWLGSRRDQADGKVIQAVLSSSPERLQGSFARDLASSKQGAKTLLSAIETGKASPRLLQVKALAELITRAGVKDADARIKALTANLIPSSKKVADLMAARLTAFRAKEFSVADGQKVFAARCAACHRIGKEGGKIGPELDGVGIRGAERLLEDILDPNRNLDPAFRQTIVTTKDGKTLAGFARMVNGKNMEIVDVAGKVTLVPVSRIKEQVLTRFSLMPEGLGEAIPEKELHHLLAYLLATSSK